MRFGHERALRIVLADLSRNAETGRSALAADIWDFTLVPAFASNQRSVVSADYRRHGPRSLLG